MIPRYAMLDLWIAVGLGTNPRDFDLWYDEMGYAESWATLCQTVADQRA